MSLAGSFFFPVETDCAFLEIETGHETVYCEQRTSHTERFYMPQVTEPKPALTADAHAQNE